LSALSAAELAPTTASERVAGPTVRFTADLVCPWCWIGFTRLLALRTDCRLVWQPFLLNPHLPLEGVPRAAYLERKFGNLAQARVGLGRAARAAAGDGLRLHPDLAGRQPSTVLAHALVLAAAERGRLGETAALLFELALGRGADIGAAAVLEPVAARVGLRLEAVLPMIEHVLAGHNEACRTGTEGVPMYRFGADHLIAGAQPVEALQALADLESYRCR
jgi:predicted DsbA family dithiol-disulfide isomerase